MYEFRAGFGELEGRVVQGAPIGPDPSIPKPAEDLMVAGVLADVGPSGRADHALRKPFRQEAAQLIERWFPPDEAVGKGVKR